MSEYERNIAIMEGELCAASDAYFSARQGASHAEVKCFEAGFKRAWELQQAKIDAKIVKLEDKLQEMHGLLPCPYCGSEAEIFHITDSESENWDGKYIECKNRSCGATSRIAFGEDADLVLVYRWNKRQHESKKPCGECHLKPGETCDICGAIEQSKSIGGTK